jgi:hypothetical protein
MDPKLMEPLEGVAHPCGIRDRENRCLGIRTGRSIPMMQTVRVVRFDLNLNGLDPAEKIGRCSICRAHSSARYPVRRIV